MEKYTDKVLIVDDVPKNIQVLGNLLREEGYRTSFATSGDEALRLMGEVDFDLILLDIMMPGMNGYEVCRALRDNEKNRNLPVIFVTAKISHEDIVQGFESGGQDYVTKPFHSRELLARVRTQIRLKRQREQLAELNQNLEERIADRTVHLEKANNRLSRLEKSKSDFLALISHELRTPLTGVIGFAEMLDNTPLNMEQREYLKYLKASSSRLMRFADMATLFTSLQVENFLLKPTRIKLSALLLNSLKQYAIEIHDKGIRIMNRVESDQFSVWGDEELLQIACNSILENAITYCSELEGCIWLLASKEDGNVKLTFLDNGKGFSPKILEGEYEPFTSENVMKHHQGFGLGLPTVKLIMDLHGASVNLSNHPDGGGMVEIVFLETI